MVVQQAWPHIWAGLCSTGSYTAVFVQTKQTKQTKQTQTYKTQLFCHSIHPPHFFALRNSFGFST